MRKHAHFQPQTLSDRLALWMVRCMAVPRQWIFGDRHKHHLLVLETVAAIPGMVAGALIHFSCLRRIADDKGWIETLIKEADTERKHLLAIRAVVEPTWWDRCMIWLGQIFFLTIYTIAYIVCPKACHRFVGYLEEDAVQGYEIYIEYLKKHPEENTAAPAIAYDFWELPKKATLKDVMVVILREEMHHRDVNHRFANAKKNGGKP